jgi:hypothetical protein
VVPVGNDDADDHHDVELSDETGRRGRARLPGGFPLSWTVTQVRCLREGHTPVARATASARVCWAPQARVVASRRSASTDIRQ